MPAVRLFEVGPRDGLQNEPRQIPVAEKIALVDLLSRSGLTHIECASFVSPRWVPQMAGSGEVLRGITRAEGVSYAALTPNLRGFEEAQAARADEVAVFAAASEGFSRANINANIAESFERFAPILAEAKKAGISVRSYVSCVIECPYDGPIDPAQVAGVVEKLLDLGCYEVSLGDTIGAGTPDTVRALLERVLTVAAPSQLAGHFHDTNGRALDNIDVALDLGLRRFDTAVGGLGGCPYAPGASGNVATEAVARHLTRKGHAHGLDLAVIDAAAEMARAMRGDADV
ncbi:hydroxymethylglutaryl-CoA lyase [Thalassorhabdomicrobium marinisediminis]|uniref:Hydroxymethylglutaryl-CoA lyase n=1 Tax=Thalassorhabdomicrobium marinisediminis TaxID=2170577 RepID=A0A2T7G0J3_9RHOB|nr:hydroxymethylglutaryl-CoA lyase [Thalassorhabdomicrobium marinisediminis]PVA07954.1 hydroxymethylglutaryl-CoA lyase [Thalassorhabdomicrobium marinisediminis]